MEELITQLLSFFKGIWKHRWYFMAVSWVILIGGWLTIYKLPDNYQASARVFVDTESLLKPLLSGMTTIPNVEQQVSIMSRTLLSRPNVERVVRMADLDLKTKSAKDAETVVTDLMKEIKIGGTITNDIYTITYNNADPKVAKSVVQSLLTIFIEGSFGDKKQDSANAVRFIDQQIKQYEEKLIAAENAMKEFKLKNSSLLVSGKTGDYNGKLAESAGQLSQARLELAEAEQARNSVRRQIASEEPVGKVAENEKAVVGVNPELDERIKTLTKNLDAFRLQYTEAHPDVVSTRRLITQLEARRAEEAKQQGPTSTGSIGRNYSPVLQQLKVALSDAEARVASMRARVDEYASRNASLRALSNAAPEVESQLAQLNRDYEINKTNYEKLISSREAAKLSGSLSATTEMMSFRIIDPPTVPLKPVGPNRPRLFGIVFAAALLAGLGFALLVSQVRPTFLSHAQLREITSLPVLGSVSMNWTDHEKQRRRRSMLAFGSSFAVLLVLFSGAMAMMLLKS
ncbi:MAG: XrtA system polysaccharide chain length determinant [Pseudomonadota bacterium]